VCSSDLLSTQWFVKTEPLAARCREALENADPRFVPERWSKVYRDWLTDIRDWCISRQLWWGHRIPAWFVVSETGGAITDSTPYVVARDEAEAQVKAEAQFTGGVHAHPVELEQDPDALDTWFSSGLWPFSTLGWPDAQAAFDHFAHKRAFARWDPQVLRDYIAHGTQDETTPQGTRRVLAFDREVETAIYNTLPHNLGRLLAAHPLQCPAAFIGGLDSQEMKRVGMAMTLRVTQGRTMMLDGSHLFPMERPLATAAAIEAALLNLQTIA
jgi:hypothetical protein